MKVSEIFFSVEGEGIEIGRPEVFIRLAGCNLRCKWCDTKYALQNGKEIDIDEIIQKVSKYPYKNVSITGGEPLLQKELVNLIRELKTMNYWIQINTNGTIFDEEVFKQIDLISMDCKCPSSGMESDLEVLKRTKELFSSKTQFKFVILDEEDYKYAKKIVSSLNAPNVVFQPEWNSMKFAEKLVELIREDGLNVRVIVQQQKVIWSVKRGV
ncbi:MAG TPA: radical SAM protein [Archaeoglobaceae archaeon]|nr:radical SAM protein [Archaeoglobaceae archaeon]